MPSPPKRKKSWGFFWVDGNLVRTSMLCLVPITSDFNLTFLIPSHACFNSSFEQHAILVTDGTEAVVEGAMVLARTDRRKDRVEVGYEQLAAASEMAENQAKLSGREVCACGCVSGCDVCVCIQVAWWQGGGGGLRNMIFSADSFPRN
jgi:hypothetical protein